MHVNSRITFFSSIECFFFFFFFFSWRRSIMRRRGCAEARVSVKFLSGTCHNNGMEALRSVYGFFPAEHSSFMYSSWSSSWWTSFHNESSSSFSNWKEVTLIHIIHQKGGFYCILKVLHASKRSGFLACAVCETPQHISFSLVVPETLLAWKAAFWSMVLIREK